jgi:hypothetical protein
MRDCSAVASHRMVRFVVWFRFAVAAGVLACSIGSAQSDSLWQPYVDPALGYSILYPAGLFEPPPVREHGGITLRSRSGAELFIFGGPNRDGRSLALAADQLSRTGDVYQVTYRQLGRSWLVLSGYLSDGPGGAPRSIFYERIALSADQRSLSGFRLVYPPFQRALFDPIIATIGNSLRPPPAAVASVSPDRGRFDPTGSLARLNHGEWCRSRYSTYDPGTDSYLRFDGQRVPCVDRPE